MALQVVRGGKDPKKKTPKRETVFFCPKCKVREGIETAMTIQVKIGQFYRGGKLTGGERRHLCMYCFRAGEVNYVD